MDLTHSFTVPSLVDEAWALFMDLEAVGNCFPGATVTEVTDDGFSGTVKVKLGPIALVYAGSGSFVERDEVAHRAVIEAKGKDKRGNGTAGATVTIQLSPDGDGARADVVTDLSVTGKPAQFGRGVMQDVSDKLLQAFVACVEQQLTAAPPAPPEQPAPDQATTSQSSGPTAPSSVRPVPPATPAPTPSAQSSVRPVPPATPASRSDYPAAVGEDDALDLGAAVLPVLLRRYGGFAAAGIIGVLIGLLLGRRRARRGD